MEVTAQVTKWIRTRPATFFFPALHCGSTLLLHSAIGLSIYFSAFLRESVQGTLNLLVGIHNSDFLHIATGITLVYAIGVLQVTLNLLLKIALTHCTWDLLNHQPMNLGKGVQIAISRLPWILARSLWIGGIPLALLVTICLTKTFFVVFMFMLFSLYRLYLRLFVSDDSQLLLDARITKALVIPVVSCEPRNTKPKERALHLTRDCWGEVASGSYVMGFIFKNANLAILAAIVVGEVMAFLLESMSLFIASSVFGAYFIFYLYAMSSMLLNIFHTFLYDYAVNKRVPDGFPEPFLKNAFR